MNPLGGSGVAYPRGREVHIGLDAWDLRPASEADVIGVMREYEDSQVPDEQTSTAVLARLAEIRQARAGEVPPPKLLQPLLEVSLAPPLARRDVDSGQARGEQAERGAEQRHYQQAFDRADNVPGCVRRADVPAPCYPVSQCAVQAVLG